MLSTIPPRCPNILYKLDASHSPNVMAPEALMRLLQKIVARDA